MYDTIRFWFEKPLVGRLYLPTIKSRLSIACGLTRVTEQLTTGKLKNLKVNINSWGIFIEGSLSKFAYDTNLVLVSRVDTFQIIEYLSDLLGLDFKKAIITRLDFGTQVVIKYKPQFYYQYLGEKRYFRRFKSTANTLYYNTNSKKLSFYDKHKELNKRDKDTARLVENLNLLRYEVSYKHKLNEKFNWSKIKGATLYDEKFYTRIVNVWYEEYESIQKRYKPSYKNLNQIKTPKHAKEVILGLLLNQVDPNIVNSIIMDMKAKRVFNDPKYYSRLKSDLLKCQNNPGFIERSELITELDGKILEAKNGLLCLV